MEIIDNLQKIKTKALSMKMGILFFLLIISTVPRFFIDGIISERQQFQRLAEDSVIEGWATRPQLGSIGMVIPVNYLSQIPERDQETNEIKNYKNINMREEVFISPELLNISAESEKEIRRRGIFEIPVHKTKIHIEADIQVPQDLKTEIPNETWVANNHSVKIGFGHSNAFSVSEFELYLDGKKMRGQRNSDDISINGLDFKPGQQIKIKADLQMMVFSGLDLSMSASEAQVQVKSDWPHPSFKGLHPVQREIKQTGFLATWKLTQPTIDRGITIDFIKPVDIYSESARALKYGMLTTLLVLSTLFCIELMAGLKIHEMQYLLMTLPLASFYMLLVALSEHFGFTFSYIISAGAVISLVAIYFLGIGATLKLSSALSTLLTIVYTLIYTMLISEDFALAIGAICLFAALSAFMILTRKLDWSNVNLGLKT